MTNCPQCGADIKNVPAGVSKKTGKPYSAFQACSANCGWKPNGRMPMAQQNQPKPSPAPDWDEIGRGKVRHAFWLELFKYQLSRGDYDKQIEGKQMSGVIGVYVEKVMGEGRGAKPEDLFPDSKPSDIEF